LNDLKDNPTPPHPYLFLYMAEKAGFATATVRAAAIIRGQSQILPRWFFFKARHSNHG
jgi:hypothetical protein